MTKPWTWPIRNNRAGAVDERGRPVLTGVVADRWFEIFDIQRPGDAAWPPRVQPMLDWLAYVEIQCPE